MIREACYDQTQASGQNACENNQGLADSYGKSATAFAAAVGAMAAVRPAVWILRALGLLGPTELLAVAGGAAYLGGQLPPAPGNHSMATPGGIDTPFSGTAPPLSSDDYQPPWYERLGHWFRGGSSEPEITVPRPPSAAAATMQHAHDFFRGKGLTEEQTAGILSNMAAESGFDPTRSGDNGSSYGLFQEHAARLAAMRARYRTNTPSEQQQLDYAWDEMNGPERSVLDRLRRVNTAGQSGAVFTGFERPADDPGEAFRRGQAADQFVQHPGGSVQVDVTLRGAPPRTTALVTTSGAASAGALRIETSMPMAR